MEKCTIEKGRISFSISKKKYTELQKAIKKYGLENLSINWSASFGPIVENKE